MYQPIQILLVIEQSFIDNCWVDDYPEKTALYCKSITNSGGIPIILNPYSDIYQASQIAHGLLIAGGMDIPPQYYFGENQESHINVRTHPQGKIRMEFTKKLLQLLPENIPVLGICLGLQFINVFYGGTLVQHIENHEKHIHGHQRKISIKRNSLLEKLIEDEDLEVNCYHHQAVDKLVLMKTGQFMGLKMKINKEDGFQGYSGIQKDLKMKGTRRFSYPLLIKEENY